METSQATHREGEKRGLWSHFPAVHPSPRRAFRVCLSIQAALGTGTGGTQWLLEVMGQQQQPRASRSQRLQDTDVPGGPVPAAPHKMGHEHQKPQRRTQTSTEAQLCTVEMVLPTGWGGGKAATQSMALGACSTSSVLPWGCQGLKKPTPSSSIRRIHGVKPFTHKQGGPMTRWELLWARQLLQTRTIYWWFRHRSKVSRAAQRGQTQAEDRVWMDTRTQGGKRSCELLQSQGDICRHQEAVRWLRQSTGELPGHILAGTSRSSCALSYSCAVTEDSGA